jgi:hypothetical protein
LAAGKRTDLRMVKTEEPLKETKGPLKKLLSKYPQKDLHRNVQSSITHNSKSRNKQMSIYWRMEKQTFYLCTTEYSSAIKKN